MSRISAYKVIQADGNRALADEVQRFIDEGWEPHGSALYRGESLDDGSFQVRLCQAIVKREPEHEELERLREMERLVGQIDDEIDTSRGTIGDVSALIYVQELLGKALRNGPYERKPANG